MDEDAINKAENIYSNTLKNPTTQDRTSVLQGLLIDTFKEHLKGGDVSKIADALSQCAIIMAYGLTFIWGNQVSNLTAENPKLNSFGGVMGMMMSTFVEFTNSVKNVTKTLDVISDTESMVDLSKNKNIMKMKPRSIEHVFAQTLAMQLDEETEIRTEKSASKIMYDMMREIGKTMLAEAPHKDFQLAVIKGSVDGLTTSIAWQLAALRRVMEASGETEEDINRVANDLLDTIKKVALKRFHMAVAKDQLSRAEPAGNA